ncbi:MAG: division plane positioning ATPase MipZ [Pseudomonadota bacterium]
MGAPASGAFFICANEDAKGLTGVTAPHVIVLGNEKGGSGKSTTAMHLFVALSRQGHTVGAIDLDVRQQSFFRYLDNRAAYADRHGVSLKLPKLAAVEPSDAKLRAEAADEDRANLVAAVQHLSRDCPFVIIDTPGAATPLSEAAHALADTLITPMNDSLIDFDLLGRVNPGTGKVEGPSVYSEMVWSARQHRAVAGKPPTDWAVLRNRMATLDSRNKRKVGGVLAELSKRIGFRVIPGFSERVIFRELFLNGLTLLDIRKEGLISMTMSHVAARQELRDMIKALNLPGVGKV